MHRNVILTLLIAGAFLTLGAKWTEKPIEDIASIAGEWRGTGSAASGQFYFITLVFKEDGSLDYSQTFKGRNEKSSQRPPGTLHQAGRTLTYQDSEGLAWTITLYEDKSGKRLLRGRRKDGSHWKVKQKRAKAQPSPPTSTIASKGTSVSTSTRRSTSNSKGCPQHGTGTATLSWTAPTRSTDGSLENVREYRIYCGLTRSTSAMKMIDTVKPPATAAVVKNLSPGKYFFAIIAVSTSGTPSDFSNVVTKKID